MKHPPQEPNAVPPNLAVAAILGVIAAIAIGCVAANAIAAWRTAELHGDPRAPSERLRGVPPEVVPPGVNAMETLPFRVQAQGLESHRVAEAWLSSYGWVDRGRRILHVPIEVAFDVFLASRLSSRPAAPAAPPASRPGGAP
jgi:hypothetical protein